MTAKLHRLYTLLAFVAAVSLPRLAESGCAKRHMS
jgi:hypothetical protein